MKRLLIPAILAAVVLSAGVFALSPVERASTVHVGLGKVLNGSASTADISDGDDYTLTCTAPFMIPTLYIDSSGVDDALVIQDLTVDGRIVAEFAGNIEALDNEFEDIYADALDTSDMNTIGATQSLSFNFSVTPANEPNNDPVTVVVVVQTNGSCTATLT
jgi:hypothetical protein